ncbi:MAG: UTP--glucose-1-phosphate uridylyltransferase, partial [Clostridiales bacterium]|nr:UTP--glucose-1-phosphate uridylyltransferase [Clostridiales bacterium]
MMRIDFENEKMLLRQHLQEHLLDFYMELDDKQKKELLEQIFSIDFELIDRLSKSLNTGPQNDVIEPIDVFDTLSMTSEKRKELFDVGNGFVSEGEVAVVTLAGGQASRLGADVPKGTFDMGFPNHKTLFEIQNDMLRSACHKREIPWFIMTGSENHSSTVSFFESKKFFFFLYIGFFTQGSIPAISKDGKILLKDKSGIRMVQD